MGVLLAIYAAVMLAVSAISNRDQMGSAFASVAFGVVVAGGFLVLLSKFGYTLPILRSREEVAELRAARLAARQTRSGKAPVETVEGPRARPAPTRRTSTGPSQHPRRTSSSRKR
mgnify:CR=1 FL=1